MISNNSTQFFKFTLIYSYLKLYTHTLTLTLTYTYYCSIAGLYSSERWVTHWSTILTWTLWRPLCSHVITCYHDNILSYSLLFTYLWTPSCEMWSVLLNWHPKLLIKYVAFLSKYVTFLIFCHLQPHFLIFGP